MLHMPILFIFLTCYALFAADTCLRSVSFQCAFHTGNANGKHDGYGTKAGRKGLLQKNY
jgi:hypothetical protein